MQRAGVFGPEGPKEFRGGRRAEVVGVLRCPARPALEPLAGIVVARLRTDPEVELVNHYLIAAAFRTHWRPPPRCGILNLPNAPRTRAR